MAEPQRRDTPVEDKAQLVAYLARGCKTPDQWRIGTEHEKFGYRLSDKKALTYEGPQGIRTLFEGLQQFGWQPEMENGNPIALKLNGQSVTLEPGGQLELSGGMLENLHQTCDEVHTHLHQVKQVSEKMGIGFLGLGFTPHLKRDEIPVMPKGRYDIMRAYMPTRGKLGLDMMLRTSTVQVNLDFSSEADMIKKFRVGLALQPIATALFANSPFREGKPNGFLSLRSHIWSDTDPDRTGMLPFVLEDGMGFERYADYVLDVPMYFVYRDGKYIDAKGQSFRDFLAGKLPAYPGHKPLLGDWEDHLTTLFPEVRMKTFLEMRGADGGPWSILCALPALWVGLLYDSTALDAAWDLIKDWSAEECQTLRDAVPRTALKTEFRNHTVRDVAREVLAISEHGLQARHRLSGTGDSETLFLAPLHDIVASGITPAERLLEAYNTRWQGDLNHIYAEFSY